MRNVTHLRWLGAVFQGQYLPSLSINYVAINKDLEKLPPQSVSDKDENLLWSRLQWHRSCHSNEMRLLPILLAAVFLGTGNCSSRIVYGSYFLQEPPRCSCSLSEICTSVIEIFWDKVLMVRNTVKKGESWCLAVICRKWSTFNMQLQLIVVSIFLKRVWNIMEITELQPIARKKVLISMYRGALVCGL